METRPDIHAGLDKQMDAFLPGIAGWDVTVVIVKNAGHWILEEQPADTIAALTAFLDK